MKHLKKLFLFVLCFSLLSCKSGDKNKFTIKGNIKNIENQNIFLEQLYFGDKAPDILDTALIENGNFILNGVTNEEGLFRLRLEKSKNIYVVINDQSEIILNADANYEGIEGQNVNTPGNISLKNLILGYVTKTENLNKLNAEIDSLKNSGSDSLAIIAVSKFDDLQKEYKTFIINYIDSCKDPIVTLFALGYSNSFDQSEVKKSIENLSKRFPNHKGISTALEEYQKFITRQQKPSGTKPAVGNMAPDFTMNDSEDKPFSLHDLKGQYVLVDFWASWCGPCRGENPNVVAAFNKYKNKNFTVLGVSLDESKEDWMKAIKKDKLTWKHISDLKGWQSEVVSLYGFDGIPYNVLIDPQGKILATELRGSDLEDFLNKTLGK